jgi:hypothetical protein
MQYFYEQAVANEGYTDSQEQYNDNYVDSQLRAQLAPGTLGMFSHGRKDYRMERKYDSPEMKAAAKDIRNYLKGEYQKGGESKRKKYRFIKDTEEAKQFPADEWGQYIQEEPEVVVRPLTPEQQQARNMEWARMEMVRRNPHLYLPDGTLRPQAAEAADWFWQLGMTGPAALKATGSLLAKQIPKTGITYGTALNTAAGIHGATQVPQRIQDWQDVAAGEKDWKEAAAESLMTGLELYGGYEGLNALRFKPDPNMYYRGIGKKGYEDAISTGLFRQAGVDSGVPRHNRVWWASNKQGFNRANDFSKDYIAEVPRSSFPEIGDEFFGLKIPARGTKRHIPIEEGRILKKHWLKGYKEVPKELPGSPNSFKSQIDWAKWNPDTPNYPELINEYNAIEQTTKANGTWMKNPDGSPFKGSPEQFIQQNSSWFKKAFGDSKLINPDGSPTIQYHGSAKKFDTFDESKFQLGDAGYSGRGIYTSPSKTTGEGYALSSASFHKGEIEPTVYELYGQANNPISSSQLINENKGRNLFNFHRDENWQGKLSPYESLREYDAAISDQLTGVQNIRPWHDAREVVFPTNKQLKSAIGNVGFFDMTNPNIYKIAIPGIIGAGIQGLDRQQNGGEPKNRKLKLRKGDYDPQNEAGYIQETPDVNVVDPTIWGKYGRKYEENVSEEDFVNKKKKQYLALHPGLTKKSGLTMDYFPADVEQNFRDAYDYNKHTAMVKGVAKEEGWNPKQRDTYVDDLNAQGTRIISDSKYGSKLQPNTWSRSLAGLQELGNTLVPGQPFKYNIPGLTKAEQKQMREDPTSALEIFAPATTLGQITANAAKNRGLSYGSDYKELPGVLSGEFMPNVDDSDAAGLDPIQMALGIYSGAQLPALATQLPGLVTKGVKSAANTAQGIYDAGTDIKGIYNAGKGSNLAFATAPEAQAARALQEAGILGKNIDPKVLGRFPGLGQSTARQALKNYNTTYRAVTPDITNASIDELMNMAKSGVTNFDDPVEIAQYMSTHIPMESYGYRANPLTPGVNQDLLYTAKYPNAETAAEKLRQYGTYLTEVRPSMDFSTGDAKDWFSKYYTDKPFGIDRSGEIVSKFKNEGNWLTGYKPGTIAAKRDYTYLPYIGQKGQKVLEPIRTTKLQPKTISSSFVDMPTELPGSPNNSFSIFPKKPTPIEGIDLSKGRASKTINPAKEIYIDPKTGLKRRGDTIYLGAEWGPKYRGRYNNSKYADPALLEESMQPYLLPEDQLRLRYPWMYE